MNPREEATWKEEEEHTSAPCVFDSNGVSLLSNCIKTLIVV